MTTDIYAGFAERYDLFHGEFGQHDPEQVSFFLQRPVDRIALNAGGALAARQALQRHLSDSTGRLAGKSRWR